MFIGFSDELRKIAAKVNLPVELSKRLGQTLEKIRPPSKLVSGKGGRMAAFAEAIPRRHSGDPGRYFTKALQRPTVQGEPWSAAFRPDIPHK